MNEWLLGMPLTETTSPLELLWTTVMLVGAFRYGWRWRVVAYERALLPRVRRRAMDVADRLNEARYWAANIDVLWQAGLCVWFWAYAVAGILGMMEPPAPAPLYENPNSTLAVELLLGGAVGLIIVGERVSQQTRRIRELISTELERSDLITGASP